MKRNQFSLEPDEDAGGFEEEYIDDDYGGGPVAAKKPAIGGKVKNDFWEPQPPANKSNAPLGGVGASKGL